MTQTTPSGDVVVKFTGDREEDEEFHAKTENIVSAPEGTLWSFQPFTLWFYDEGQNATYECSGCGQDDEIYLKADLVGQPAPPANVRSRFPKGRSALI
jgi:hypothetical protein